MLKTYAFTTKAVYYQNWFDGSNWHNDMVLRDGTHYGCNVLQNITNGDHRLPNVFEAKWYRYTAIAGTKVVKSPKLSYGDGTYTGPIWYPGAYGFNPVLPETQLWNSALSDLFDQLRGGLDLSVDAFQGKQNVDMVKGWSKDSLKARFLNSGLITRRCNQVISLAQRMRGLLRSGLRSAGSIRLEYMYGVKPLLQDIYDTYSQLMESSLAGDNQLRYRGRSSITVTDNVDTQVSSKTAIVTKAKTHYRCEIVVFLNPNTSSLQRLSQFSSLNPASIAWELLPYSFVVDWFVNVGGYLRDLETALAFGSRFRTGYVTYGYSSEQEHGFHGPLDAYTVLHADGRSRLRYKKRYRLTSMPLPRIPVLDVHLGSSRLLNAAAMLSQFLSKRSRI